MKVYGLKLVSTIGQNRMEGCLKGPQLHMGGS